MIEVKDIALFSIYFILFAVLHSLTASLWFKRIVEAHLGKFYAFYRALYVLFSIITWILFMHLLAPKIPGNLYSIKEPLNYAFRTIRGLAVIMFIVTTLQFDILQFIGLRQLYVFFTNRGQREDKLITGGVFRFVRHPLYFFAIIFLWFTPEMSMHRFLLNFWITLYLIAGTYLEEPKLEAKYGEVYTEYKKGVSKIVPLKWIFKQD